MFPEIFGSSSYVFFNNLGVVACVISSLFFFKLKANAMGFYSKAIVGFASTKNERLGKVLKAVLISFESILVATAVTGSTMENHSFGDFVGTGANHFAAMLLCVPLVVLVCLVLMINPLKQLDIATLLALIYLFFVKLGCFGNGCCRGIPWEHGMYNYNEHYLGYQVPVQLIEALCALAIFFFLLWYRKKAKIGTLYPMYVILYSATRFCSEFFRHEENVLWIFKTYHLLCIAGFVIGLILFFIIRAFGQKLSDRFDDIPNKVGARLDEFKERAAAELALEKAENEALKAERLEKAKAAREKAKARNKSKARKK